ncbi:hypothetical protein [Haloferax sp. KTX1]|uniref:hypothetical protein n=1 Tax=Haloferax sp. KTX1 TaxID=2600597 RepID=UPI0011DD98BF|nr:hypothetical protein [Haloferax sp. KTX1]
MTFPSGLAPELTDGVMKSIDYWKEYRGQVVRIEQTEFEVRDGDPQKTTRITHGVEGTVAKVMTLPPGFLLEDAVYFSNPEKQSLENVPTGASYRDDAGEMFVSFDSIERMVFPNR